MAIGLLVEEGKLSLDENIYDIFQKKLNTFNKIFRPKVTVENLLHNDQRRHFQRIRDRLWKRLAHQLPEFSISAPRGNSSTTA